MGYGLIALTLVSLIVAYVIVQESRARLHWRRLVEQGDTSAIRALVENQLDAWRKSKVPKGTPAALWHAVQTAEIVDVTADRLRVACTAEGAYVPVDGVRREVSSVLAEAMRVTARLGEMLLYDIPDVKAQVVQVDVYSTFRGPDGEASQQRVLSTAFEREAAAELDWDGLQPEEIVAEMGGQYRVSESGTVLPLDTEPGLPGGSG